MALSNMHPWQVAQLTPSQIAALTRSDLASITIPQLRQLSAAQFSAFSPNQISWIPPAALNYVFPSVFATLAPAVVASFTASQVAGLRNTQVAAMTVKQAQSLSASEVAALTPPQLKHLSVPVLQALVGLTLGQVMHLPPARIGELSAAQFASVIAPNLQMFGAWRLSGLSAAQVATLTVGEVNGLTAGKIAAIPASALAALSPSVLAGLRPALVQALTPDQLNGMGAAALSSLDGALLTSQQVGSLTGATVAALTAQQFAALLGGQVSSLSAQALASTSVADLSALTSAQLAGFTQAQIKMMTASQISVVLAAKAVAADVAAHEINGTLTYAGALAVLQDAAQGGMTQPKFAALTSVAQSLASGAIKASGYVAQAFSDVVFGNSANAWWTGGGTGRTALGDLSATSTQTQTSELIGKWFLGTDLPDPSISGFPVPLVYQQENLPLYGASGAPQMADITQGQTGDCYFLASLAEIALQDPTSIENMIKSNGNGTYSVEFQINGQADYVTVNSELVNMGGGYTTGNGQTLIYANGYGTAWAPLIEKAFVQLNEQSAATHGGDGSAVNSYAGISGGWATVFGELTGQSVTPYFTYSGESGTAETQLLSTLQSALASGQEVEMATSGQFMKASTNLVAGHMFAVVGVDAAAETVTLFNPWGHNSGNMAVEFTKSFADLAADNVTFAATTGKSVFG